MSQDLNDEGVMPNLPDNEAVEAQENKFDADIGKIHMRELRAILDDSDDPRYEAALTSARSAMQPLLESRQKWAKSISTGSLDGILGYAGAQTQTIVDAFNKARPPIDVGAFTGIHSEAVQNILKSAQPHVDINKLIGISGAQSRLAAAIPEAVLNPVKLPDISNHRSWHEQTLQEIAATNREKADRDDASHQTLLAISSALIDLNRKSNEEAERTKIAGEMADTRQKAEEDRLTANRGRETRRFWIGTGLTVISIVGVAATLWLTVHPIN